MTTPTTDPTAAAVAAERPPLPMTIPVAARYHRVSTTTVKRWVNQGRVPSSRVGGGAHRAAAVLIHSYERPERAAPGTLTEDQRRAWNKGKKKPAQPQQQQ